ncbi:MAG TPA: Flp pilus assembly complex ATPase component TadA [Clostridia bacterium]|nr:Flp pilus assembly complex ATPase component TadA [Clostridia bacterium]
MAINKSVIGETFVRAGQITEEQLKLVQKKQETTGKRLEDVLQEEGLMTEEEIKQFLKRKFNIGFVDLAKQEIQTDTPLLLSEELARKYTVIPFKKSSYRLLVAMADPYDLQAIEELTVATELNILPRQAEAKEIMKKINDHYGEEQSGDLSPAAEIDFAEEEKIVKLRAQSKLEEEAKKAEEAAKKQAELEVKRKAEEAARKKAEAEAQKAEEEARQRAEEEAKRKAEAEARRRAEEEAKRRAEEAQRKAEEEARKRAEAEAKKKAETEAKRKAAEKAKKQAELEAKRKAKEESKKKIALEEEKGRKKAGKDEVLSEEKEEKKLSKQEKKKLETKRARLGAILVEKGLISEDNLEAALKIQKETKKKLGEILVDNGLVQEDDLVDILSEQMGFPYVELSKVLINPKVPGLIKESLARKHVLIPIKIENGRLVVAMSDPLNVYAVDDIRIATGYGVIPYIAGKREILKAIEFHYGQQSTEEAIEDLMRELDAEEMEELDQKTLDEINNAPLVRLVNSLLRQAVIMKASDIHVEPFESRVRVRFRIDGDLQEIMSLDINTHAAVVARIKIMGKMDIAEKRIPQDGRVGIKIEDRRIDLRLASMPTTYGEKMVIRLLDRENIFIHKSQLGFTEANIERLDKIIRYPYGIILATGPTGCGKTSTLYTVLSELNKVNRNIITIEDPVEFKISGINQVQVNPKANLTFANGLRSILRQDPDIIMVGEIRDTETVQIAVRAAITGHLVLSTVHTNDTASTIIRLIDMGIEPYLISNSVVGIIAQRLVKKICPECKEKYQSTEKERLLLEIDSSVPLYTGRGCPTCNNTGYKGRTAIAEIMEMDAKVKRLIDIGESADLIKQTAKEHGMIDLQENCRELVLNGVTTIDEYIRNTYIS